MPNSDFSEIKNGLGGRAMSPPKLKGPGKVPSGTMKPAFPGAKAGGNTQSTKGKGVRRAKVYANSDGL